MKSKFINQIERSKINYDENKEHKASIDLAETKFSNKDHDEAVKANSNDINFLSTLMRNLLICVIKDL